MPIVIIIIIKRSPPSEAAQIPGNVHGLVPFPSTRLEALWAMSPKLRAGSCAKQAQKNGWSTLWNFKCHPKLLEKTQPKQNPGGTYWHLLIFGPTSDVCTDVYIVWTCFTFFSLSPVLLVANSQSDSCMGWRGPSPKATLMVSAGMSLTRPSPGALSGMEEFFPKLMGRLISRTP